MPTVFPVYAIQFAVWNVALSLSDIAAVASAGAMDASVSNASRAKLLAYYQFDSDKDPEEGKAEPSVWDSKAGTYTGLSTTFVSSTTGQVSRLPGEVRELKRVHQGRAHASSPPPPASLSCCCCPDVPH